MKENKSNKINEILTFPERLNTLTLFMIVVLYVVVIGVFSFVISPGVNYTIVPNYKHQLYNEDFSVYFKITNTIEIDDSKKITQKGTLTEIFASNLKGEDQRINYEVSRLDNDGSIHYLYSGKRSNYATLPNSHTLISNVTVTNGGYKSLFGNFKYYLYPNEEEITTYSIREDIINLTRKELNKAKTIEKELEDKFGFSYTFTESGTGRTSVTVNVRILTMEEWYHLDFQTFAITSKGEIYPLVGFYGYYSDLKRAISGYTTFDSKVEVVAFVAKANYYDENGNLTNYLYKEAIA